MSMTWFFSFKTGIFIVPCMGTLFLYSFCFRSCFMLFSFQFDFIDKEFLLIIFLIGLSMSTPFSIALLMSPSVVTPIYLLLLPELDYSL